MANLSCNLASLAVSEIDNVLERHLVRIRPDSSVLGRDSALWGDGHDLSDDQGGTTSSKAAEMLLVPEGHMTIIGGVLAHGGDDDTVVQGHAAKLERLEENGSSGRILRCTRRGVLWRGPEGGLEEQVSAIGGDCEGKSDTYLIVSHFGG